MPADIPPPPSSITRSPLVSTTIRSLPGPERAPIDAQDRQTSNRSTCSSRTVKPMAAWPGLSVSGVTGWAHSGNGGTGGAASAGQPERSAATSGAVQGNAGISGDSLWSSGRAFHGYRLEGWWGTKASLSTQGRCCELFQRKKGGGGRGGGGGKEGGGEEEGWCHGSGCTYS